MIADEPAKGSRILLGARRGSGWQEGGWVVRRDGLRAEGDEVGVVGGGEGVDGFGGGEGLLAEGCGFGARCGVEYRGMRWARAAAQALRRAAVGRRMLSAKVERSGLGASD